MYDLQPATAVHVCASDTTRYDSRNKPNRVPTAAWVKKSWSRRPQQQNSPHRSVCGRTTNLEIWSAQLPASLLFPTGQLQIIDMRLRTDRSYDTPHCNSGERVHNTTHTSFEIDRAHQDKNSVQIIITDLTERQPTERTTGVYVRSRLYRTSCHIFLLLIVAHQQKDSLRRVFIL